MKSLVPILLATVIFVPGCATTGTPAPEATAPAAPAPAPSTPVPSAPAPPAERAYAFTCDNGERIQVRFSQARKLATLVRNGESVELPQQPSGSGFIYGNGRTTLRGKGDDLILEIGKMAPIRCQEG